MRKVPEDSILAPGSLACIERCDHFLGNKAVGRGLYSFILDISGEEALCNYME